VFFHGTSFDMMIVPDAANMPPTPWQAEILAPGSAPGGAAFGKKVPASPCPTRPISSSPQVGCAMEAIVSGGEGSRDFGWLTAGLD
jgi:hypothetical protein